MVFYGAGANSGLATKTAANVQNQWNAAGGKVTIGGQEYSVKFSVTGSYRDDLSSKEIAGNTDIQNNYIKVDATTDLSSKGSYTDVSGDNAGGNTGFYRTSDIDGSDATTGAHEMGHGWGEEHPASGDLIGQGQPGIMAPRGTLVDPKYQHDPNAKPGDKDGTINPAKRKVTQDNINALGLDKLNYDKNGKADLGTLTNKSH
jgi:hypothetical protein